MAREDGRQAAKQPQAPPQAQPQHLTETSGSSPPSPPPPDYQGAAMPVAQATGANGLAKPGLPEKWERWTHDRNQRVEAVGDLKIVVPWLCGDVRTLPASYHAKALDMGLECLGDCAPDAATIKAGQRAAADEAARRSGVRVDPNAEWEIWTHGNPVPITEIAGIKIGGERKDGTPKGSWWAGERKSLPRGAHQEAVARGLQYVGPAS